MGQRISEENAIAGVIAPVSQAAGTVTSGWIDCAYYTSLMAVISTGVLGTGATVDAKWQVADDSSGTNTVDSNLPAITQVVKASGDNKQITMDFGTGRSTPRTKRFVRLSMTVGTAASLVTAVILGRARHMPVTDFDPTSVVQNV